MKVILWMNHFAYRDLSKDCFALGVKSQKRVPLLLLTETQCLKPRAAIALDFVFKIGAYRLKHEHCTKNTGLNCV